MQKGGPKPGGSGLDEKRGRNRTGEGEGAETAKQHPAGQAGVTGSKCMRERARKGKGGEVIGT